MIMLRAFLDWMLGEENHNIETFEKRAQLANELPPYVTQGEDMKIICHDILIARV